MSPWLVVGLATSCLCYEENTVWLHVFMRVDKEAIVDNQGFCLQIILAAVSSVFTITMEEIVDADIVRQAGIPSMFRPNTDT